jgi:guanine deaminase
MKTEIVLTCILNPKSDKKCDFIKDGAIAIFNGKIVEYGPSFKILKKYENINASIIDRSKFIALPTFFDMHFHWVQDDVRLMPKDSLLTWLSKYTWPYEAKFKSLDYTKKKAKNFRNELIKCGTLGGACYASIHPHTVDVALSEFVGDFIVGNVLMTMNSPDYLCQSKTDAINSVSKLSKKYKNRYAVTPRFAPTTDPDVMKKASMIGKKNNSFIQTHLSETPSEIDYVLSIYKKFKEFKNVKNYSSIYHQSKILGPKTIMGHGIYLKNDELKLLQKTKTAICHCPTSNASTKELGLGSGLFNFKLTEKYKIPWALGSDIGGGPYLSMFDVMRSFVLQNKKKHIIEATFTKALYRSTLAGAKILKLDKTNGSLDKNKFANIIFVSAPNISKNETAESLLKKIISKNYQHRHKYDSEVLETIFHGKTIYSSIKR